MFSQIKKHKFLLQCAVLSSALQSKSLVVFGISYLNLTE